ncbi:GntR family transcriptional regulator [Clostridium sp. LIBA-8841]|uniref:GntR family transcriptional regulator n=1 Tax=Clostridium sp. LIBA-8841 TaxID=2987530 RepID=UPI002AC78114|nr:GntR family transcriptional regulator [Clostridium sp. LIBA-8841]MDZ5253374.1 GntR family transcriptional regulator [Clostridium sp. LIBA-8841]
MHLHNKIENYILDKIESGELSEGEVLPTEMQLSEKFSVSRPTVRQALNSLVNKGYLKRIKGRGTFVTKPKIVQDNTRFIESYNREMNNKGLKPITRVLGKEIILADSKIAEKLEIGEGDKVIRIERLRFAERENKKDDTNHKPVLLTNVYLPYKVAREVLGNDLESTSLYDILESRGLKVCRVVREIEAKNADYKTARLLEINEGKAIHYLSSIGYLKSGKPIEYSESIYPGERNTFIVELNLN